MTTQNLNDFQVKIGHFALLTGLSVDTLRFYERERLIRCQRNSGNQREYSFDDFKWSQIMKTLIELGMKIKELQIIADFHYAGNSDKETMTLNLAVALIEDQLKSLKFLIDQH